MWNILVDSTGLDAVLGKALGRFEPLGMQWLGNTVPGRWVWPLTTLPSANQRKVAYLGDIHYYLGATSIIGRNRPHGAG